MKKLTAAGLLFVLLFMNPVLILGFYEDEIDAIVYKINENSHEQSVRFGFITDLHYDDFPPFSEDSIHKQLTALVQIASKTDLDFIALGGDLYSGYGYQSSKQNAKDLLKKMLIPLEGSKIPVLILKGNHDDNSYYRSPSSELFYLDKRILNEEDYYALTTARFQEIDNQNHSYFYFDLVEKNTRIIVLNSSDYPLLKNKDGKLQYAGENFLGYSHEQLKWLVDIALNQADIKYILLSHVGADMYEISHRDELNLIMKSLNEKTIYTGVGTTRDFNGYQGLELYCFGHAHADKLTRSLKIGDAVSISVGSAVIYNMPASEDETENGYSRVLGRDYGNFSECLFDIIINNPTEVLCLRFGAGEDRAINKFGSAPFDPSSKEGWWQEDGMRKYYINGTKQTGWLQDGPFWYFFDKDGRMQTGWEFIGDTWYHLTENGMMTTGWIHLSDTWYYLNENGGMVTGKQMIEGRMNSFSQSGAWMGYEE